MTKEEAKANGYEVEAASQFEVGLSHKGRGLKTWWCYHFDCKLPDLDHPKIMEAIENHEKHLVFMKTGVWKD